jgi:transcriptional regulator with XRE-family HTH domain
LPEVRSPTVRRRELGALLRALRNEKGLTVEQVAERLLCSPSKVSRMETGHGIATPRDIRDLCDLYDVSSEAERERFMALAKEGKQQGWWQDYDLPYSTYVGLEAEAASIKIYDSAVVPGLLQTAEYAQALHEASVPRHDANTISQWVKARAARQLILTRDDPPTLHVILDEAVVHRLIGDSEIMRAQLARVIAAADMPNITVQVIPYETGAHPALDSVFTILDFLSSAPTVIYVEGLVGHIYLEQPRDTERYNMAFDQLSGMALDAEASAAFLAKAVKDHAAKSKNTLYDASSPSYSGSARQQ